MLKDTPEKIRVKPVSNCQPIDRDSRSLSTRPPGPRYFRLTGPSTQPLDDVVGAEGSDDVSGDVNSSNSTPDLTLQTLLYLMNRHGE